MASEIIERLIKIDASQGAASMRELYDVVEDAKKSIADLDKSSDGYQRGLVDLKTAQNKYAEATRIAVANNENAKGSFNDLTGQLRILKEQWKKTADEQERAQLTEKINAVKEEINGMNESIGNFQHNVGNYQSHWKALGETFDKTKELLDANAKGFTSASNGVDILGKSMKAVATGNPLLMLLTLILPLFNTLKDELAKNETFINAIKRAMEAFAPVLDLVTKGIQKLAEGLAKVVNSVVGWFTKNKDATASVNEQADALDNETTATDKLTAATERLTEAQKRMAEVINAINGAYDVLDKKEARAQKRREEFEKLFGKGIAEDIAQDWRDVQDEIGAITDEIQDDIVFGLGEELSAELMANDAFAQSLIPVKTQWEEFAESLKETWANYADSIASITNSIADIIEAQSGEDGKNAGKVKALRIATATIDTISGAVGAFMNAVKSSPTPVVGIPLGVASAAAVTAAGLANIAKIKAVKTGGAEASTATPSIGAVQSAPPVAQSLTHTTTITGASQEQRLDDLLDKQSQPVVLVWSDAERMAKYGNERKAETTFR